MAATSAPLTIQEIKMMHVVERNLYCILTMTLRRDPSETIKVIALWLWLETVALKNVVKLVLALSDSHLIHRIADEATSYIHYVLANASAENIELPLTRRLLAIEIAPDFFFRNRVSAFLGIQDTLNKVSFALQDLMQQAESMNNARVLVQNQIAAASVEDRLSRLNINNSHSVSPQINCMSRVVHPDDRSLFATFSRGYPVCEGEIRDLLNLLCGNCIESIHMGDVQDGEQPLSARIVLCNPDVIEVVLGGVKVAKFIINNKHVWMRKYVAKPKRKKALPPRLSSQRPSTSGIGPSR